ncbi:aldehyde dehydrogenase (NADP(+)) [Sodalis sp. RH14]|uniref:aldehyde dehydrogenase (NADP(+)) n=1 Tax=Sodalis sp. RH14 TaxID=3394329 RepID=UPI0039B3C86F
MELTGNLIIGSEMQQGGGTRFHAADPAGDRPLAPDFYDAAPAQIDRACQLAEQAFDVYRALPLTLRADFLTRIGDNIQALGDALIARAVQETGLPRGRIEGERARTLGQLALFAEVVRRGEFLQVIIEQALPARKPLPRPDLRQRHIALGPVAVFGASNFPLAFSVAGGDSASALAAGCPIVVKAHPAHPGTSELVGRAIQQAAEQLRLPPGVFSLLHGAEHSVGERLVAHPLIQAVGFTGSRAGGLALVAQARQRAVPIPVYAEMSSVNPQILLPAALAHRGAAIAGGYVESLTLGAGQFCTCPGLVLAIDGEPLRHFCRQVTLALREKPAATMLTGAIWRAWRENTAALGAAGGVGRLAAGQPARAPNQAQAAVLVTDAGDFLAQPSLSQEVFGPTSLVVRCRDNRQLLAVVQALEGQLTVSLHLDDADHDDARALLPTLERRAGRLLVNGFPTGVDVGYAMVHGGPFPATSDARTTSVGAGAISRFLRPVCYQDFPAALLPPELRPHGAAPV